MSPEEGLSDTAIITLASDREGNVWVGTRAGGLNGSRCGRFCVVPSEDDMEVPPMSLAEAGAGSLWVAAQGHGIYRLRQAGNEWSVKTFLAAAQPYGPILTTRDGSLWLGAATHLQQWREGSR